MTVGRLIGCTGRAGRFTSSASFANYARAAPIQVASAGKPGTASHVVVTASSTPLYSRKSAGEWDPPGHQNCVYTRREAGP